MATSWEDLELNDLSLKDLRITTPPPPPPGKKPSESANKAAQGVEYGTPSLLKPSSATAGGAAETADNPHGVDKALLDTLKDAKERIQVLRFEVEVERFVQDGSRDRFEFPGQLTPFQRMIAHRVAQHYFLQTSVETQDDGVRVVAWKIPRANHKPSVRLVDIPMPTDSSTASGAGGAAPGSVASGSGGVGAGSVKVMRRVGSKEGTIGAEQQAPTMDADTMERIAKQREEEYNIARERIFSSGNLAAGGSGSECEGDGDASVLSEPGRAEGTDDVAASSPATDAVASPDQGGSDRDGNSAADPNGSGSVPSPTGSSSGGSKAGGGGSSSSKGRPGSGKASSRGRGGGNEGGEEGGQQSGGKGRSRSGRQKAVFRDKDKDSMDPDFRRGRHRFEQRFDPNSYGGMPMGPGAHGAIYAMPTYTAEFPSLGGGMGVPQHQGGHHGAPLVPHMLPPQQQPPPPPPPQQQGHQQSHQHQQQWPHGGMQQQGMPPGMPPQYAGQPQGGHPHQHPSMPPQYGGMRMPPPYGMHPQPGMYHPHHPPPPLPFGGIPMPPAGHYGFMPPHPHVQSPTGGQPQQPGGAAAAAAAAQFHQHQAAFAMQQQQQQQQGYAPEGVASIVTPPPSGDGKQ